MKFAPCLSVGLVTLTGVLFGTQEPERVVVTRQELAAVVTRVDAAFAEGKRLPATDGLSALAVTNDEFDAISELFFSLNLIGAKERLEAMAEALGAPRDRGAEIREERPLEELEGKALRERALARLATVVAPELEPAVRVLRSKLKLPWEDPSPEISVEFLIEPAAFEKGLKEELAALERGVDPYRDRRGDFWRTFSHGRRQLAARVFAPSAAPKEGLPLVIAFHGAGGDENFLFELGGNGYIKELATAHGCLVVAPFTPDHLFGPKPFESLLMGIGQAYDVDLDSVYLLGHSMGAMAVSKLCAEVPELITAASCVAGFREGDFDEDLPILVISGERDRIVPFDNVRTSAERAKSRGARVTFEGLPDQGHTLLLPVAMDRAFAGWFGRTSEPSLVSPGRPGTSSSGIGVTPGFSPPTPIQADSGQPRGGSRFGRSVLTLHDMNGDGLPEFAVGAPAAGHVFAMDGKSREVLMRWSGGEAGMLGVSLEPLPDVDGDGHGDVLVGFDLGDVAEVRASSTGARLGSVPVAAANVHFAGDVNGDGAPDLLVQDQKRWTFFTAKGAKELFSIEVEHGAPFVPVGDLNGDGVLDGIQRSGRGLSVTSRREGDRVAFETRPHPAVEEANLSLWNAGRAKDVDGDGALDILVAALPASGQSLIRLIHGGGGDRPLTKIHDQDPSPPEPSFGREWGYELELVDDLDGDGHPDAVLPDGQVPFGVTVRAFSLMKGTELWSSTWEDCGAITAAAVEPFVDVDGDGIVDLLVGSSDYHWHGKVWPLGNVQLLSGATGKPIWKIMESETTDAARFEKATQWRHRLLIVAGADERRAEQLARLRSQEAAALDRKIVVLEITESQVRTVIGELPLDLTPEFLLERFEMAKLSFEMTLVGLDGGAKESYFDEVDAEDVWKVIDVMPMRQREVRDR